MKRILSCLLVALTALSQPSMAQQIAYQELALPELTLPEPALQDLTVPALVMPELVMPKAQPLGIEAGKAPAIPGRFVHAPAAAIPSGVARFGPFRVLDETHAALVDITSVRSPAQFNAMMRAYPGIKTLEMVECPGTDDDQANLALGRLIHEKGMITHVPTGGSVRSGAVELFLAGTERYAETGSEFAVHSWLDDQGREPDDYSENAPQNLAYIEYYKAMGMTLEEARSFYAMTNSVPNASARWLDQSEMDRWVRLDRPAGKLDTAFALN